MSATPARDVESRLTAALHARADQVTHDDLTTLLVPTPQRSRRPALIAAGVAAAVATAIVAVPLVGGDDGSAPRPAPAPSPSVPEQGRTEVGADLDGDGAEDRARIVGDQLHVELASGTAITAGVSTGSRLLPPAAELGTPHPALVVAPPADTTVSGLFVSWRDGALRVEHTDALGTWGGRTVWVDDVGGLSSGDYDPSVPLDQRVLVDVTAYRLTDGELRGLPGGNLCWDRVTHAYPVSCEQLPARAGDPSLMFPMVAERLAVGEHFPEYDGRYNDAVLERTGDGVELVFTWDAVERRAAVPAGGVPELVGSAIPSSVDAPAFVVAQRSGDTTTMTVFAPSRRGFGPVPTQDGSFLGDRPAGADGEPAQRTWVAGSSALWTARQVSPDVPSRYALVRWHEEGGVLVPEDQGEACLDLDAGRKLPDSACGA